MYYGTQREYANMGSCLQFTYFRIENRKPRIADFACSIFTPLNLIALTYSKRMI